MNCMKCSKALMKNLSSQIFNYSISTESKVIEVVTLWPGTSSFFDNFHFMFYHSQKSPSLSHFIRITIL